MYQDEDFRYSQDFFGDDDENEVTGQPGSFLDRYPPNFLPADAELELSPESLFQFTDSDGSIRNMMNNSDLLNANRLALGSDSATETKLGIPGLISHPNAVSVSGVPIPGGSYIIVNPGNNVPLQPEDMIPEIEDGLFESWSGDSINFRITPLVDAKKALYSEEKKKVYCNTGTAVAFKAQMEFQKIGNLDELMIRSFLAFRDNGSRNRAVLRCPIHSEKEKLATDEFNYARLDHVLRPQNPKANMTYFQNEKSKRCYLLWPLKAPEPGMNFIQTTFCFTCRNSCATFGSDGKAKKDIAIMFYLFNKTTGEILGRQHIDVRVCSAPTRDYNKDHGISNGAGSGNRKRKLNDGAEAALLPSPKQVNVGSGEFPLNSFMPTEHGVVVPFVETLQMRSTVRAAKLDDDGVSSSQETVFSCDEAPERINLRRLLKDVKWVLHLKHSDDPSLADYSTLVYSSLKMTQKLCDSAKALSARKGDEQTQSETSPDGGFHDVAQD